MELIDRFAAFRTSKMVFPWGHVPFFPGAVQAMLFAILAAAATPAFTFPVRVAIITPEHFSNPARRAKARGPSARGQNRWGP